MPEVDELARWLPYAQAVVRGEYDRADASTKGSIIIGLRSLNHPSAKQAVIKLESERFKKSQK